MKKISLLVLSVFVAGFLFVILTSGKGDVEVAWDFQLVDPNMAPEEIKPLVMEGFTIILETKKMLPEYAGDRINCTNCHFSGGNTLGGENNGISLVGMTKKYPKKLPGGKEQSLEERINSCFEKSLNGKAVPIESRPMKAIVAYLKWIATPVQHVENMSWLGLRPIKSEHTPDPQNGEKLYQTYCYQCHGKDGQGQPREKDLSYPPLWGPDSFNRKAGMHDITMIAPFIYQNMPYGNPALSEEQALDIASFIIRRPRP